MEIIVNNLPYLLWGPFPHGPFGGLALTLYLSAIMGAAAACVGMVLGSLSLTPIKSVRKIALGLSICIRGVPSLAFLFWMYFLIPKLLQIDLSPFQSATIALAIYHGAYMSEDIRGGIQSVGKGQWDTANATGLGLWHTLRHVIFPQAIATVVPALINRFVNLFMYTSIVSMLGILEFMRAAVLVNNRELIYPMEIFGFVGLVYFIFCYGLTRWGRYLEKKWEWAPKVSSTNVAI